jgi:hypothetical protein
MTAMNDRMFALRQRRSVLLARTDAQRGQLAELTSNWKGQLTLADQGMAIVRFFRDYPLLIAGITALVVVRRRRFAGLVSGILRIRKGYRFVAGFLQKL